MNIEKPREFISMPRARVLIVEDESPMARNIRARLEQMEYQVFSVASCGAEAIKQAEKLKPDIVLMEIVLQGDMDGIEAAQEIRSRLDIPIIYLTACTRGELLERAKLSEPYGYIVKPVEGDELKAAIEVALHKHDMDKKLRQEIAEHKRAKEALQDYEKRYRRLFESARDGILILDADTGKLVDVNPFLLQLLGYSYDALCGQHIWELGVFKDIAASKDAFNVLRTNEYIRYEDLLLETNDGQPIAVEFVSNVYSVDHSKVIQCNIRDITERKQAQARLHQSEQFKNAILNSVPSHIAVLDRSGVILSVNAPWIRFSIENSEVEGLPALHSGPGANYLKVCRAGIGEWSEGAMAAHDGILAVLAGTLSSFSLEYPCHSPGVKRWFTMTVTPLGAKERGVVISHTDITERKRAEQEATQLAAIVEHSEDAIIGKDLDGIITSWNSGAEKIYGYAASEAVGKSISILLPPGSENELPQLLGRIMSEEPIEHYGTVRRGKNGRDIRVSLTVSPVRDAEGRIVAASTIARDITERMLAAKEKERWESQLRQAQKMEALGTLAGGIAHDFNNILSPILGYAEMVLNEIPEDNPMHFDIEEIRKAALRAKDLVLQILTFSRQREQERIPVRASLVIKEVLKLLRATLPTTIKIRKEISPTAARGTVFADPTQVHQILMNLCTNSAHAMREKGGTLAVSLEDLDLDWKSAEYRDLAPGPYLRLSVSDTGQGMTGEVRRQIFDPYFTTKAEGEGTGLGLAVVYGIVASHGGAVSVQSEPGKGTVFQVLLPKIQSTDVPVTMTSKPPSTGHGRILVVDDEPGVIEIHRRILTRLGYEVVAKSDGMEALETFRAQADRFDLVVTDQTMPKMTGVELAGELLGIRPDIPVILCTGYSDTVNEEKAKAMGIRGFLMKPLGMEVLAKTVIELLGPKEA
jgi:PAS domain S-box-containing protein